MNTREYNALDCWFPVLEKNNIPVPKTIIVKANCELIDILDGSIPNGYARFIKNLHIACDKIGCPCFLRTAHTSAKHYWKDTCFISNYRNLPEHVFNIVEFSECADLFGLNYDTWCVRKLLPVKPLFTAFHGEMPIVREFRGFWVNKKILCVHPYWPVETIQKPSVKNWEELLLESHKTTPVEYNEICKLITNVGKLFEGNWSIDLLDTEDGWYVTDMATAETSYHWEGCEKELK